MNRGVVLSTTAETYGKIPDISDTILRLHIHIQRTPRISSNFYHIKRYFQHYSLFIICILDTQFSKNLEMPQIDISTIFEKLQSKKKNQLTSQWN
jgi:hypothetical protein